MAIVSTELVTDPDHFCSLRGEWNALLAQSSQNSVFLQWEWLHTWWRVYATGGMKLQILLHRAEGQLVGVAPLYLQKKNLFSAATLRFIGTGEAVSDQVVSEYLDLFALAEYEQSLLDALTQWIAADRRWRRLRFDDMRSTALCRRLSSGLGAHGTLSEVVCGYRHFIALPDSLDEYLQRLSASRRKRYRRCHAALLRDGGAVLPGAPGKARQLEQQMLILKDLNDQRWRERSGRGVFESEKFHRFHLEVSRLLGPRGQADFKVLSLGDKPLAALYLFYSQGVCHYYQSGFSAEGANRYMPLFLSHLYAIEQCIAAQYSEYDFMRGALDSYKKDYACEVETMYRIQLWRYSLEQKLDKITIRLRARARLLLSVLKGLLPYR